MNMADIELILLIVLILLNGVLIAQLAFSDSKKEKGGKPCEKSGRKKQKIHKRYELWKKEKA